VERNPYAPPEAKVDGGTESKTVEPRPPLGGCLVVLLIVMLIINAWMMVIYLLMALGKIDASGLSPWVVPALVVSGLVNIVSLAAILHWLRWGVYLLVTTAVLISISNIFLGSNAVIVVSGLIGPGVLLLLVRPLWKHFR
jgi:hypothetical protein